VAFSHRRIGRRLITVFVIHRSLLPLPLLDLNAYVEQHHDEYRSLLHDLGLASACGRTNSPDLTQVDSRPTSAGTPASAPLIPVAPGVCLPRSVIPCANRWSLSGPRLC